MKKNRVIVAMIGPETQFAQGFSKMLAKEHDCKVIIAYNEPSDEMSKDCLYVINNLNKFINNKPFDVPIIIDEKQPNKYFNKSKNNFKR